MLECVGAVFKTLAETLLIEQIHETAASSQAGRKSCEPGWTYNQRALPFQCQMQCHCAGTQIRMQQRHTSRNSPLQDLATSAFALHWVLEVASGCRLGVATLATFCLGAPNITQLVLKDCQYPRLIPGVLYIIYIYSCIVNPTYSWIISDGYSTFPTSSCFLSLATLFLKPSRSPDWPLPFSRRCVLGAYHGEPAINWKGGARLSQEWLHNYSIYIYICE